ncbi:MAG: phosphoribosylformylglycinamidine synthase subunit PurQ [Planctomycetota bacterium]
MPSPSVLILRAPGTNCEAETAFAFEQAGAATSLEHVDRLLDNPAAVEQHQILCIPGGFSYGDDLAAGRVFANRLRTLSDTLHRFRESGGLALGICNGFQVLLKSGLLDTEDDSGPSATLAWNTSGRYTDRWVTLEAVGDKCPFLAGVGSLELPIAHAEGRFLPRDDAALSTLVDEGRAVLRYAPLAEGAPADNPNGSAADIAGLCDRTGRVLGLMPHPERCIAPTQHPQWTRRELGEAGAGLAVFKNAVAYFA